MLFGNVLRTIVAHERRHLHVFASAVRAPRKQQQAADHRRAAFRARLDRLECLEAPGIAFALVQQADREQDRREHVVEIVRNAAGQRPDAFHALRPQVLLLEMLTLGNVLERALGPDDHAASVAFRLGADAHPLSRALGGEHFRFEIECRAVLEACSRRSDDFFLPGALKEPLRVGRWRDRAVRELENVE